MNNEDQNFVESDGDSEDDELDLILNFSSEEESDDEDDDIDFPGFSQIFEIFTYDPLIKTLNYSEKQLIFNYLNIQILKTHL